MWTSYDNFYRNFGGNMNTNEMKLHKQMLSGDMYNDLSPYLIKARERAVLLTNEYNASYGQSKEKREEILNGLFKKRGKDTYFEPGFRCEFGSNISVGDYVYANFDFVILDGGEVTIGDFVLFGPKCGIFTTNHAYDFEERKQGACFAKPVVIQNHVWCGAHVVITQGVTIGENSIIGAGSVVTKDIPANVIAAGNPCKVIRSITEKDKTTYFDSKIVE